MWKSKDAAMRTELAVDKKNPNEAVHVEPPGSTAQSRKGQTAYIGLNGSRNAEGQRAR